MFRRSDPPAFVSVPCFAAERQSGSVQQTAVRGVCFVNQQLVSKTESTARKDSSVGGRFTYSSPRGFSTSSSAFFGERSRIRAPSAGFQCETESRNSTLQIFCADLYQVLGVSKNASKDEIKKAYRRLARQWHPDINKSPEGEEKFKEISKAYEILSDPEVRARYDQFGEAGVRGMESGGFGGEDMQGGWSDIFETFFGGGGFGTGGTRRRQTGPVQGDDLRLDLEIEFKTAVFGGEQTIRITHLETCSVCKGSGAKPGTRPRTCTTCGGNGQVARSTRTPFGSFSQVTPCPTCEGSGEVVESSCEACGGAGRVRANKKLSVGIPAGVDTGSRLRVRKEGDAGPKGGPPGDLYVYISVKSDSVFKREGINLYSNVKISYLDAILGARASVQTVDGPLEVDVPTGTQPNTVLKLKGKGVPRLGNPTSRGDHFLTVVVEIPTRLSGKEKKLVEELKAMK
mmetsp:Transcript_17024/g.29458  ORF Transcript_17024/g.29458 Transcript_17024/m.29458 type:complete len:457 (-) Transcript_17024:53-1423(-)